MPSPSALPLRRGLRAAATVLAAAALASCGPGKAAAPPPLEVPVVEAVRRTVDVPGEFVGQVLGKSDIEIRARVEGFLTGIHFREGAPVRKGQLLYTIDTHPFEAKVNEAEGRLATAQSGLANAEADLERIRPLAEINAVSRRDLDAAVARHGAAQGEFDAAEAGLELARIELSYCRILAPEDGLIGISRARVGDFVGRGPDQIVLNTVSSIDTVRVRFSLSEKDYLVWARRMREQDDQGKPRERQPLTLILADGTLHAHPGQATAIGREVDTQTGAITVEAVFPNPEGLLRPGQFARVRATVETRENAVVIPERAVVELQGIYRVFVASPGDTAQVRQVTLGPRVDKLRVVETGIEAGDRVIVEGAARLRPGMAVIPRPYDPGTGR